MFLILIKIFLCEIKIVEKSVKKVLFQLYQYCQYKCSTRCAAYFGNLAYFSFLLAYNSVPLLGSLGLPTLFLSAAIFSQSLKTPRQPRRRQPPCGTHWVEKYDHFSECIPLLFYFFYVIQPEEYWNNQRPFTVRSFYKRLYLSLTNMQ